MTHPAAEAAAAPLRLWRSAQHHAAALAQACSGVSGGSHAECCSNLTANMLYACVGEGTAPAPGVMPTLHRLCQVLCRVVCGPSMHAPRQHVLPPSPHPYTHPTPQTLQHHHRRLTLGQARSHALALGALDPGWPGPNQVAQGDSSSNSEQPCTTSSRVRGGIRGIQVGAAGRGEERGRGGIREGAAKQLARVCVSVQECTHMCEGVC